mgnify:CR=1 FL=1
MPDSTRRPSPDAQAEQRIQEILRAAESWSKEAPSALMPPIRAVCIRLAEMVADQRHYLAPLPEPQETERRTVLSMVADRLRSKPVTQGVEQHLKALEELELRFRDLDLLVEWCEPGEGVKALDVATGGGHVARRLRELPLLRAAFAGPLTWTWPTSPGPTGVPWSSRSLTS